MPRNVTQFDLLISCPSDVKEELEIIKETVEEFNRMFGAANNCSIVSKHWSKDSYPQSGGKPQHLLNNQFVLDCDAAVAVFWTRFGTPTDNYGSGTEEEIQELLKSGKQVFLYFCDRPISPSLFDPEQYAKVTEFKEKYKDKGIYFPYSDLSDFKTKFLNHLSLHFIRLLSNDSTNNVSETSKFSIKGVVDGKISDNSVMYNTNLLDTQFMTDKKSKILEEFKHIKKIQLERESELKKYTSEISDKNSSDKLNNLLNIGKVSLKFQEQMKGINSIFSSSKVDISEEIITEIRKYAQENSIIINDEFFYIGNLSKQNQPFGGGPYGTSPSYSLVGSDKEKEKYNLILELYDEIIKYTQWEKYFKDLSSKCYLKLALCNFGTRFDEDIDIKVYIKSGYLCKNNQLPIPGEDILEDVNTIDLIDILFRPKKSLSVIEYEDYPTSIPALDIPFGISGATYIEQIESEKNTYKKSVESLFCYDYFQHNEFDVICFKQPYLKQNTNVLFPSILVFNSFVDSIHYEISSKHFPEIIKGQINPKLEN
jgi:hypothetical protein